MRQRSRSILKVGCLELRKAQRRFHSLAARINRSIRTKNLVLSIRNAAHRAKRAINGLPTPPAKLMRLVAGGDDVSWYIRGGELALQSILEVLDRNGIDFENFDAVLDFGCGCGRVTQHWGGTRVQLYGCDYNSELIQWASKNLPKVRFEVNTLSPTLAFSEAQFTFIYALSVFTHLTEPLQEGWMKELLRIVHPDGYLLITLHGSHYLSVMTADEQREFLTGRLVVREPTEAGSNTCATFHPERYVRERLAKRWQVVDFVPKGASGNPYQDIYLLRPQ